MKVLITGATGYIGKRIIPLLLNEGHTVVCAVRGKLRTERKYFDEDDIEVVEADFLKPETLKNIPKDIDAAYYLIHSMSTSVDQFHKMEEACAVNFKNYIETTDVKQVIYLSGITNDTKLSKHLLSRKNVENTLKSNIYALTVFKAGIIVGSGSASFEIIRDLVEKLPVMITPKWLNTKTQPIGIRDVLSFLVNALGKKELFKTSHDIFGPEILTYKTMLLQFAEIRKLKRYIITLPVMTPKLSSYWLYFVTSTSYKLARSLVNSMGIEIIGKPSNINTILNVKPMTYKNAVALAFEKIESNHITSSWKDALINSRHKKRASSKYLKVPKFGCFKDIKEQTVLDEQRTLDKIWAIGGENGWYYGNFLWKIRGFLDKLVGGIGLRRGRTNKTEIHTGDALDFWRVLLADRQQKRLILFAEMKLPGEAWLEFRVNNGKVYQRATFRPRGLAGRLYWYSVLPFHGFIFKGMINQLAKA
ncbi:SDR family oxidoreductase [Aestuariibaculum suncheonense]|uniref:SDR family oxidoreductase n=1 Tax=Aestuariibaculum suncheonense TaxID=1028745 RepID=A0A8J6Q731_9FLAO|nr:SDR family oxidoreductase [Aestuariibaculum suncheonense]MBD0835196.1 SDR family oxidoreductase [Aestuariibaculum suncheonense]